MVGLVRRFFRSFDMSWLKTAILTAAICLCMGQIALAESLSTAGSVLTDVSVDPTAADITRTIDLNGDTPIATYVMAHTTGGKSLQRTNLGYWIPWGGKVDALIDNGFQANGASVTYKLIDQDISSFMFPITFVVAYRTSSALKFGVFQVSPKPTSSN